MKYFLTLSAALTLLPSVYAGLEDAKFSTVLTPNNFDNVIASQSEGTLVAFFAPWCGHCKNLEGTWSKIAEAFDGDDRCKVAHLNADESAARPISSRYGVSGFPTLKFIEPPSKGGKVDTYNGARTEEAFLEYLNEKCGTQKGPGGVLSDIAGRIPSLDNLAGAYLSPSSPRSSILSSASSLSSSLSTRSSEMSAYYLKLMTKWSQLAEDNVEDAKKWIQGESDRLGKMIGKGKGKIQRGKLEEMKMKQNILSVFASATSYVSQASSTASSLASSASSSLSSQATIAGSSISSAANVGSSSVSSAGSIVSSSASSLATGASKSASSLASGVSASVKSVVGGGGASKSASSVSSGASSGASQMSSTVASVAAKVTDRVKEEL